MIRLFAFFVSLSSVLSVAQAAKLDISPFATLGLSYDSNVFRVADAAEAIEQTGDSKQDDYRALGEAGLTLEGGYSEQALLLSGRVGRHEFAHFDGLDHTDYHLEGDWDWRVGRLFHGELEYLQERELEDFDNREISLLGFVTRRRATFDVNLDVSPSWRLAGRLRRFFRDTSRSLSGEFDRNETDTSLEWQYRSRPVLLVALALRLRDGNYPNRARQSLQGERAVEYEEQRLRVRTEWRPSQVTQIDAWLAWVDRQHPGVRVRDFNGLAGAVSYRYRYSSKTEFLAQVSREIHSVDLVDSDFILVQGLRGAVEWTFSPSLAASAELGFYQRDYSGGSVNATDRKDDLLEVATALHYRLLSWLTLSPRLAFENRESNSEDRDYQFVNFGFFVQAGF